MQFSCSSRLCRHGIVASTMNTLSSHLTKRSRVHVAPSDITQTPCRAVTAQPPTRIKLLMRSRGLLLPLRVTVDIRTAREVHADTVATRRETYISWNIYHAETSRDSQQLVSRAGQSLRSKVTLEWGSILEREKERRVKRVLRLYLLLRNDRNDSFSPE